MLVLWLAAGLAAAGQSAFSFGTSAEAVNTIGYEDSPFLSPDGQRLYFMYAPWSTWPVLFGGEPRRQGPDRPGHHTNPDNNAFEDSDLYVSVRNADGTWGTPSNLAINDDRADCCAMTWDGRVFYYQRTQWASSALTDIYTAAQGPDGRWTRTPAGPGVNSAGYAESNPHLSADGTQLFFTSNRPGGYGGNDLYVSSKGADGAWEPAVSLGARINTADDEDQAWIGRDGATLYFNRYPGAHVLRSVRSGGTWSVPEAVLFDGQAQLAGEVSITDDGTLMSVASVRPDLEDIVLSLARRMPDGRWGPLTAVSTRPSAPRNLSITR